MCGIVGFIGKKKAAPMVLEALKKLEYRGYDSAGIATGVDGRLCIQKGIGKLDSVDQKCHFGLLPGIAGIGHVRWATHGGVTDENAHPHFDCHHRIAVVHNGIIENYQELRAQLSSDHKFTSDTDTEVIPHLLEEYMAEGMTLEEAVLHLNKKLEGSYALVVISTEKPRKLVATRKESPMVVGLGEKGNFISSDALSFTDEANRVIFIEDGETVVLTGKDYRVIDGGGRRIERQPQKVDWKCQTASKEGYDYFMLKEIMEQPRAIRSALAQDDSLIRTMALNILRAKQVVFTACGTSRYASLIGRHLFSKIAGRSSEVIMASEFQYFADHVDKDTLVIAVSQSGETADVIGGVKKAKEKGATIFSLVNVVGSSLSRMSDKVIYLNCGSEIGVAATKSFSNELAIFYLLAFAMDNRLEEGIEELGLASHLIEDSLVRMKDEIPRVVARMNGENDCYYIARGINSAVANEGALKMKEIAYVHAEGLDAGELKHGTLALIRQGIPVVAICPCDYTFSENLANIAEAKARQAFVIGVSDKEDGIFDEWIRIPAVDELFYPLVTVTPLQLLAYYSAISRGLDPDKPRNLAKSVTVK